MAWLAIIDVLGVRAWRHRAKSSNEQEVVVHRGTDMEHYPEHCMCRESWVRDVGLKLWKLEKTSPVM